LHFAFYKQFGGTMFSNELTNAAKQLAKKLLAKNLKLTTAESCTGGGVSHLLTSLPGSSAWFERGFVTYSNEAKMQMLGVEANCLENYGAVSEPTALAMADGALTNSLADIAVSITGIAGPDGGSLAKPVGTVWFGVAYKESGNATVQSKTLCCQFKGDRVAVREQAIQTALDEVLALLR
jgi:nicotinamide-nucleotide amidase